MTIDVMGLSTFLALDLQHPATSKMSLVSQLPGRSLADRQLAPEDEADGIEVAWEDQQKINTFSKLNNRLGDLRDQLKVKEVRMHCGAAPLRSMSCICPCAQLSGFQPVAWRWADCTSASGTAAPFRRPSGQSAVS